MSARQSLVLLFLFALCGLTAAWLQFGVLNVAPSPARAADTAQPDYEIENLTSTGRDNFGRKYKLRAAHLAHYPHGDYAILIRPRVTQYGADDQVARRINADRARWTAEEILLEGNVKVLETHGTDTAETAVQQMRIPLGNKAGN